MTLQEVKNKIHEYKVKCDFINEQSEPNQKLLATHLGEFEAILSGNGDEKYLVPETAGTLCFLYRGQNEEYFPCLPSIYRDTPSAVEIFIERMRLTVFRRMLQSHPVVKYFFNRHHFVVDEEGLAQHYGLKTSVLDLTSSLDVALFFATCKYDGVADKYYYYDDNIERQAILYVFDPILDNEPAPPALLKKYMRGNIRPIGLQAFPRPGVQDAYSLHIPEGGSTKSWIYKFTFSSDDSKYYYNKYNEGEALWAHDYLIPITKKIASQMTFSFDVFNETYECYRPKGYSKTKLKKEINQKLSCIRLLKYVPDVVFSQEEQTNIINEWNDYRGGKVCQTIVRKPWFNFDDNDKTTRKLKGIHNRSEFMTFDHMTDYRILKYIAVPEGPEGAEWCNYKNTPLPPEKKHPQNNGWEEVEASMNTVFGKPWLTEDDWLIKV